MAVLLVFVIYFFATLSSRCLSYGIALIFGNYLFALILIFIASMSHRRDGSRNYSKGLISEDIAILHLEKLGFVLLERRWKSSVGEVDLIFVSDSGNNLLFVEVKTRCAIGGRSCSSWPVVSPAQAYRLWCSIEEFVARGGEFNSNASIRFDIIVIESPEMAVRHFPNVLLQDLLS